MFTGTYTKNYDEGNHDAEDFSPDTSEYQPSPNRKTNSRSESTTSSLGGDLNCIDGLIDSKLNYSPSTISNLSILLGNVDFIASPTAIYKVDRTPSQIKDRLRIEYQTSPYIASTSNNNETEENVNDQTLIQVNETEIEVQNYTLKEMDVVIHIEDIFEENEGLLIVPYGEENKENNENTHITLLNPVSPFIMETKTNESQQEKQHNVTGTVQLHEYPLMTITQDTAADTNTEGIVTPSNKKNTRKRSYNKQKIKMVR